MSKKVVWGAPKITSSVKKPGSYNNFKEMFAKATERQAEQDQAIEYLNKAMPALNALLEFRLQKGESLVVMRPLQYQTSQLNIEEEDNFYHNRNADTKVPQFQDVMKTIMPGTVLVLKSLDTGLQEFVFRDGMGKEHCISFSEKNKLLTQTDIFEEVRNFIGQQK